MSNDMDLVLRLSALDKMSGVVRGAVKSSDEEFEKLQKKVQGVADKFDAVGKASLVAGGLIAAPLAFGVKKAADFEEQLSSIKSITGATTVEMAKLRGLALKMGADTKYSALEAAQGIEELEKAGVSTTQVLNGGLSGALNLAAASGIPLADAAEIASTALNAFRDDSLSVAVAGNILAGAANASATSVGELKYSLSACASVASGVGMSFKDTNIALALFAQNGLKGSDAGTSLKSMLMNLQPRTDAQVAEFVKLGLATGKLVKVSKDGKEKYQLLSNAFFDSHGRLKNLNQISGLLHDKMKGLTSQQRMFALETMFGSDAIRAANILFKEGADGADKMWSAMSKVKAIDVATIRMDNLKGSIEQMMGSIDTAAISYGSKLTPAINSITKGVTAATNAFNAMPEPIQSAIAITGALTAVSLIGLGGISLAAGAATRAYGQYLECVRDFRPIIESNSKKLLQFLGLNTTLHNIETARNIKTAGNKFGFDLSNFSVKNGLMADIRRINNELKISRVNAMLANSAMASSPIGAVRAMGSAFMGLNAIIAANPIGLIVAGVAVSAFVIMKYWKPITAFFKGVWSGVVEATKPLQPAFKRVAGAVKPVFDWFKKLISPINTAAESSTNFGKSVGRAIGGAITWIAKLINKIVTLNGLWKAPWSKNANLAKGPDAKINGSHANGLQNVPYDGYIAELHKDERVLTASENKQLKRQSSGGSMTLVYNPQITTEAIKDVKDLEKVLKKHKEEIKHMLDESKRRQEARAYAT